MESIYIREKDGGYRYRRIEEGRGKKTGNLKGPFYARPTISGKQTWQRLSAETFADAKKEIAELRAALDAAARGLTVAEAEQAANAGRTPVKTAIEIYLAQKGGKKKKTRQRYQLVLNLFRELVGARFLDEVTEGALREYKQRLEALGRYSARSVRDHLKIVYFLLKKNGIAARLPRDEMPTVEEEPAVPYSEEELKKLFAAMNEEQTIRYKFFLGTGCRDKEVVFATWADIDLDRGTYTVRSKPDVGFTVKNHESRTVPLPDGLIEMLKARKRKSYCARWLFVNRKGEPDNHFLDKLKAIALRAGLNCGQCKTEITKGRYGREHKVKVTCATDPVCGHIKLHRFRKTCATRWQDARIPVRTIQAWLGHKELETTMGYLGVGDIEKLRGRINEAFGD